MDIKQVNITDNNLQWINSEVFPYYPLKYPKLNPVQSAFFRYYDQDDNVIVETPTSSGKTIVAEMSIANALIKHKKNAVYIIPSKDIARQQTDEWTDSSHPLSKYNITIATGDVSQTVDRNKLLNDILNSQLCIITNELYDSLSRKPSFITKWLKDVHTIIIDEAHYVDEPKRGSALESAIIRTTEIAPHVRLILLSATMSNSMEIAQWVQNLSNRNTVLITSKWRPCKLNIHFIPYYSTNGRTMQVEFTTKIKNLFDKYSNDKFLIFTHTKGKLPNSIIRALNTMGYNMKFHNANLTKTDRDRIVDAFKDKEKGLQYLMATSTVAVGMNLPARRVIIMDVYRGKKEVSDKQINQMIGRAGRAGIDPEGDAYILVPFKHSLYWHSKITQPSRIESRMKDDNELAFHLISEINNGRNTLEAIITWYKKTLAYLQDNNHKLTNLTGALEILKQFQAITLEDLNGTFKTTYIGKIASWLYYSPVTVFHMMKGLAAITNYIKMNNKMPNDYILSWFVGKAFKYSAGDIYISPASNPFDSFYSNLYWHVNMYYHNGYAQDIPVNKNIAQFPYVFFYWLDGSLHDYRVAADLNIPYSLLSSLTMEMGRFCQLIQLLAQFNKKIDKKAAELLKIRLLYGSPQKYTELLQIKGIGIKKAELLYKHGYKTIEDILNNPEKASAIAKVNFSENLNNLKSLTFRFKQISTPSTTENNFYLS